MVINCSKVEMSRCFGSISCIVPVCFSTVLFQEGAHGRGRKGRVDSMCCPAALTIPSVPALLWDPRGGVMGIFDAL